MANRQVARVDDSWYGGTHVSEDDKDRINRRGDAYGGSSLPVVPRNPGTQQDPPQKTKKYSLPMEPTESLDRGRDYPPIITADGRVDTDIDHLMENQEDDVGDSPVQDIPNKYPKPHVVRVVDGSLDDDIDNLINHDGTMAHTLVDAPKGFSGRDIKEISSSKSPPRPSPSTNPVTKKDNNAITNRQSSASRVLSRMNRDASDEESPMSPGAGSKVVPYFERNNSSKAPTINNDDADFCHLNQSLEDQYLVCETPDTDKATITFSNAEEEPENIPVFGNGWNKEGDVKLASEHEEIGENDKEVKNENLEKINKSEDVSQAETSSDMGEGPGSKNASDISVIVQQLLKTISKEQLEKHLGTENKEESKMSAILSISQTMSDSNKSITTVDPCATGKATDTSSPVSMLDAIAVLKQSLDRISNDSEASQSSESEKLLAVTALKVAGESMTAAAKMADALTCLLQSSQAGNRLCFETHPIVPIPTDKAADNSVKKLDTGISAAITSEPISLEENKETKSLETNPPENIINDETPKIINPSKSRRNGWSEKGYDCKPSIEVEDQEEEKEDEMEEEKNKKISSDSDIDEKQKQKTGKEKKEHAHSHSHSQKVSSRKHKEHDDKSYRDSESRCRSEYEKSHSDKKRRDSKHKDSKEDRHRKRSSSKRKEQDREMDDEYIANGDYLERDSRKMNEHGYTRHRSREISTGEYELHGNVKETNDERGHSHDGSKVRRDKRSSNREDRHQKRYRGSPQRTSCKYPVDMTQLKTAHNMNESHSPDGYAYDLDNSIKTFSRYSSRGTSDDISPFDDSEAFVRSHPWTMPRGGEQPVERERYFDQVVRQLKPFSPTRNSIPDFRRDEIRARLVGTCVDPGARDSDFDSIEFNANAKTSDSTRVCFDDEYEEWHYDIEDCSD